MNTPTNSHKAWTEKGGYVFSIEEADLVISNGRSQRQSWLRPYAGWIPLPQAIPDRPAKGYSDRLLGVPT